MGVGVRIWVRWDDVPAVLENAAACLITSRAISALLLICVQCPYLSRAVALRLPVMLSHLLSARHLAIAREDEAQEVVPLVWILDGEHSKGMPETGR
jgi:hypothetical protein